MLKKILLFMYEKNCLSVSVKEHCHTTPYIILLQLHPTAVNTWHRLTNTVHEVDAHAKIQFIRAHTLEKHEDDDLKTLLAYTKGPSCFLFCSSFNAFQVLLKTMTQQEKSAQLPCTVVGAKYMYTFLDRGQIKRLVYADVCLEDVFIIKRASNMMHETLGQGATAFIALCMFRVSSLHEKRVLQGE
jgi:hypothetical protein